MFREIYILIYIYICTLYHDYISIVSMYFHIINEHLNIYCTYICLQIICIYVSSSGSFYAQPWPINLFLGNHMICMPSQNQTPKDAIFAHKTSQRMFLGRNLETFLQSNNASATRDIYGL